MALKYTDNTSPTWDEVKGVETPTLLLIVTMMQKMMCTKQ